MNKLLRMLAAFAFLLAMSVAPASASVTAEPVAQVQTFDSTTCSGSPYVTMYIDTSGGPGYTICYNWSLSDFGVNPGCAVRDPDFNFCLDSWNDAVSRLDVGNMDGSHCPRFYVNKSFGGTGYTIRADEHSISGSANDAFSSARWVAC